MQLSALIETNLKLPYLSAAALLSFCLNTDLPAVCCNCLPNLSGWRANQHFLYIEPRLSEKSSDRKLIELYYANSSVVSSHTIIKSKSSPKSNVCKSQVESSFSSDGPSRVQVRVTPKSSRVESSQSRIVHRPMGYTIGLCSFYYIEQTSVGLRYRYRMKR